MVDDLKANAHSAKAEAEALRVRSASSSSDGHQLLELQVAADSHKIKIESLTRQLAAADKSRSDTIAHYEQQLEAQATRMTELERRTSRRLSNGSDSFALQADLKAARATAEEVCCEQGRASSFVLSPSTMQKENTMISFWTTLAGAGAA
jgi:hypothetical protein